MNVAVCVYTNIPIFFCFLVYVDNTRLLIHTSLYIVHISFTGIPRKFAEISLSPSASLGVDTKSLLLRAPKDGFLQLGSLSEYGDGGLLSTPLWDLRFSAAAALDGTSESESGDDFCVFHGFFWGVWGTKKYGGLPVGFFYLYWNIRWRKCVLLNITWIFFLAVQTQFYKNIFIKPFPFFLASGMTRVQYHQIIVLLVHWHGKGKLHKIQVIDQKSRT